MRRRFREGLATYISAPRQSCSTPIHPAARPCPSCQPLRAHPAIHHASHAKSIQLRRNHARHGRAVPVLIPAGVHPGRALAIEEGLARHHGAEEIWVGVVHPRICIV